MCSTCGKAFHTEAYLQQHLIKFKDDDEGHERQRLGVEERMDESKVTGRVSVTLPLTYDMFDGFAERVPLIEVRGCSEHWKKVIGGNISTIRRIVVTRAYTSRIMRFVVERIECVSKAALADMSQLHREWVKEKENDYEYYYVFFLNK